MACVAGSIFCWFLTCLSLAVLDKKDPKVAPTTLEFLPSRKITTTSTAEAPVGRKKLNPSAGCNFFFPSLQPPNLYNLSQKTSTQRHRIRPSWLSVPNLKTPTSTSFYDPANLIVRRQMPEPGSRLSCRLPRHHKTHTPPCGRACSCTLFCTTRGIERMSWSSCW